MGILKRENLINELLDSDLRDTVKLITGVRLSGKTTLIKSMMEELKARGTDEENILYYAFDSYEYYSIDRFELYRIINEKMEKLTGKVYLFFDHVEEIEDWQFIVNSFRKNSDYNVYAAVNYSKFFTLGDTSLVGKSLPFEVYPFSFKEFVQYNREFGSCDKSLNELFLEYLRYGGMPEVVQFKKHEEKIWSLKSTFDLIRYCDFKKDSDLESFLIDEFLRYMVETFTETFSKRQLNSYTYDIFDIETISKCRRLLEKSKFMLNSYKVYDRFRFFQEEKYYLVDHGFYTQLNRFNCFSPETLLKNIVYVELLRRGYRVFFTDTHEKYVDFICSDYKKQIFIQFDYIFANKNILKKEIDFLKYHAGDNDKYIITTGNYDLSDYGVRHLNIIDFLMGDEI